MENIINILIRSFPFILFIILELITLQIIRSSSDYHRSMFLNKSDYILGSVAYQIQKVNDYFDLDNKNKKIAQENAILLKEIIDLRKKVTFNLKIQDSTLINLPIQQYHIIGAKIIHSSVSKSRNYIILDKGTKDGVNTRMGVVSPSGPVGFVVEASEHYSCVMSILNKDANLSVRVKDDKSIGILRWTGGDIRVAALEELPRHIKLKKGQIIETSGFSSYFPEGISVGRVLDIQEDNSSNQNKITVLFNEDLSKLQYVYVLSKPLDHELDKIMLLKDSLQNKIDTDAP
ncbi:MAG: rod shape-determining protein MreC [Chitinophagales bacterium]|jgi:rod shape-determining protein MreC|nr:rod shape-determining protein MreC [Chitinophagales bacterium]